MAEIILFHHVYGLTAGVESFAGDLRAEGHLVHVPDLFDGAVFDSIERGLTHAEAVGFESLIERGMDAAGALPSSVVYAGFSLGALVAHKLAQTRRGALGALLFSHGDVPMETFGEAWPVGVALQIHVNEDDAWCEMGVVQEFIERAGSVASAELFIYPGSSHLFADSSLPDFDADSAHLALERSLGFLSRFG